MDIILRVKVKYYDGEYCGMRGVGKEGIRKEEEWYSE